MTDLEKSMAEIAKSNGFNRFDIGCSEGADFPLHFHVTAWWDDSADPHGVQCANGMGETIAIAVSGAIIAAARKRTPPIIEGTIQLGEAA